MEMSCGESPPASRFFIIAPEADCMNRRRIVSAFLKGVAITPLGGLIGTVIAVLTFRPTGDSLVFMMQYGTVIGSLFAAPATIGLFPVLYVIWPKRAWSTFIYVIGLSAFGGFFSPFLYLGDPPSMILEPLHIILGIIGMISAAILAPLYFRWTRRPGTIQ
jgi:hypothetical protein